MNNKGMAISGIIYSVLLLLILLILGVLSIISTSSLSLNKFKSNLISNLNGDVDKTAGFLKYKENILNGADPVIYGKVIPVTIENDGTVKKADECMEWYKYEEKKWANAVLVSDSTYDKYRKLEPGKIIENYDITSYFVWIPRYKYKIPTGKTITPSTIDIVFENSTTAKSTGDAKNSYYSHPGFTFGNNELNGIWVGKFETTGTRSNPSILPNKKSLAVYTVNEHFNIAFRFNDYWTTSFSHMMKNVEWGAVAYLSYSNYGINNKIRANNNSKYLTGCGADELSTSSTDECQISYGNDTNSQPQSTTGNITGIYDMVGGCLDRVMGNYNNNISSASFEAMPVAKYYDLYGSTSYWTACDGEPCLGDAIIETINWYDSKVYIISEERPWIIRGGDGDVDDLNITSIFTSGSSNGAGYSNLTFRVVIG